MPSYLPSGWPLGVYPPGSHDFAASAVAWLLDVLPPGYREQERVHRYPVGLASMARHHVEASLHAARRGYGTIRVELGDRLSPIEIDEVLALYRIEGGRLAAAARATVLVERALRGESFGPSPDPSSVR